MDIRTILVNLDVDFYSPHILESAAGLATLLGAKIIGLGALEPSDAVASFAGVVDRAHSYAEARLKIETSIEGLANEFQQRIPAKLQLAWHGVIRSPNDALLALSSEADLVLTTTPRVKDVSRHRTLDAGELLMSLGRPLLAIGTETTEVSLGRIVIGWKDTREARRAVADALPLLNLAEELIILTVNEGEDSIEPVSPHPLDGWLLQHGMKARHEVIPTDGDSAGVALQRFARTVDADLIVAGAYGHSRTREWLFGGMTRELLDAETANRLLSN